MGVYRFAVIFFGEVRFGHRFFEFHRETSRFRDFALRFGPDYVLYVGFGFQLPRAVGDQYGFVFQPLGFVHGQDFDGLFVALHAQRAVAALFVPPVQKQRDIGYSVSAECDDLFMHGLQIGCLLSVSLQIMPYHDAFERFFRR